jgi:hypothetical protein
MEEDQESMVRYALKVWPLTNMLGTEHGSTLGVAQRKLMRRWETARGNRRRDRAAQMAFVGASDEYSASGVTWAYMVTASEA